MVFDLCPESDVRNRVGAMMSSPDLALLVVDRVLEYRRAFLGSWVIRGIGKQLCLVD